MEAGGLPVFRNCRRGGRAAGATGVRPAAIVAKSAEWTWAKGYVSEEEAPAAIIVFDEAHDKPRAEVGYSAKISLANHTPTRTGLGQTTTHDAARSSCLFGRQWGRPPKSNESWCTGQTGMQVRLTCAKTRAELLAFPEGHNVRAIAGGVGGYCAHRIVSLDRRP